VAAGRPLQLPLPRPALGQHVLREWPERMGGEFFEDVGNVEDGGNHI